jgi:prepilin-type N-terminal cleavage/methylation domain-containing protein
MLNTSPKPDGFTLIEIVMVMAVIGLLAAVAVPRLDFQTYRINSAVRSLNGLLARAQRLAVTNQYNVNVVFDVAQSQVRIHEDDDNDNTVDGGERVRRYPLGEGVVYGRGGAPFRAYMVDPVSFTRRQSGLPVVIFRRDGSASENGGVYLTSVRAAESGRAGDARSVEVVRATGRTEWYRYNGSAWERRF